MTHSQNHDQDAAIPSKNTADSGGELLPTELLTLTDNSAIAIQQAPSIFEVLVEG